MNMAFCIECGTKLPEDARFCNNCGKAVAQAVPAVEVASEVESVVEAVAEVEATVAPVAEVVAEPEVTELVTDESVIEENVYAEVVSEPETENEPVAVAESAVVTAEEEPVNVYAEAVQTPVYVPAVPTSTEESSSTKEEQQALLDNIYARLKNERLCWKIFGFVWIGYIALFTILGFIVPELFVYVVLFAPLIIINFKMIGKVDYYMNTLYTDCEPVVKRCSSVGMIVFGALFNTVAMIFIIINFVNVKSNEKTLKDIKQNQDTYNNRI